MVAVRILKEDGRSKFKNVYVIIRARVNWEYASSVLFACTDKLRSHALITLRGHPNFTCGIITFLWFRHSYPYILLNIQFVQDCIMA